MGVAFFARGRAVQFPDEPPEVAARPPHVPRPLLPVSDPPCTPRPAVLVHTLMQGPGTRRHSGGRGYNDVTWSAAAEETRFLHSCVRRPRGCNWIGWGKFLIDLRNRRDDVRRVVAAWPRAPGTRRLLLVVGTVVTLSAVNLWAGSRFPVFVPGVGRRRDVCAVRCACFEGQPCIGKGTFV